MALVEHFATDTTNTAILNDVVKADVITMTELIGGLSAIANSVTSGLIALNETQANMLQKMESKLVRIGGVYTAAVRIYTFLDIDISSRLSNLSAVLDKRICIVEDIVRNHGAVSDRGGADCALSMSGWIAHMNRWVEDAKKALNFYVLQQHAQFIVLEKQIKGLNDQYVRETGSECHQPQRILFALEHSFLNEDHGTVYPEIRPVPLYFNAHECETWPDEERAVAVEGAKILDASLKAVSLTN